MNVLRNLDPFRHIITLRARVRPEVAGVQEFEVSGFHGTRIAGWALRRADPVGTLFHLHGFCSDSGNVEGYGFSLLDLTARFHLNLVSHDSRHHGLSGDAFPTFGSAESFDLQSVMDWANDQGFQAPFVVFGDSLGAMAAQRTAIVDERVRGAFLMNPPAWPCDAIGVEMKLATPLAVGLVNAAYRKNILADGDIRRFPPSPRHLPFILSVIGSADHYGWEKTKISFDHWYHDQPQRLGHIPCEEAEARKWFVLIEGAVHPGKDESHQIWADKAFPELVERFIVRCLRLQ